MSRPVIVTGAAGFIGSHLTETLLKQGYSVIAIDNFHPYYSRELKRENVRQVKGTAQAKDCAGEMEFIEGDLLREKDLKQLPRQPQYVFHLAAIAGVRNSVKQPSEYIKTNVLATSRLLEHVKATDKFVFASSSSVYGEVEAKELPVREERKLNPIAPYPLSKVQSERMIELYSDLYGIDYNILRYFSVYGPRQRPDEAFTKFISLALEGKEIPIYGTGEQSRDFTHVHDIVNGTVLAAETKVENDIFNLGSGRRVSVNEMVASLEDVLETEGRTLQAVNVKQPEGDVAHTQADISKAKDKLGYEPQVSFEQGTKDCVGWVDKMKETGIELS